MAYDVFVTKTHRAILTVMASVPKERKEGKYFDSSLIEADADGKKYLYPGMILAAETDNNTYYVPFSTGASYGTDSDTAVGILNEFVDVSLIPQIISPVTEGTFIEGYCFELGGTFGTVGSGIKTNLSHIQWK